MTLINSTPANKKGLLSNQGTTRESRVQRHAEIAVHNPSPTNSIARDWLSGYGKPNPSTAFLITSIGRNPDIFTSMGLRHVDVRAKRDHIKTPQQIGPAIENTRTRRQSTKSSKATIFSERVPARKLEHITSASKGHYCTRVSYTSFHGSRFTLKQAVAFPTIGRFVAKSHTVI